MILFVFNMKCYEMGFDELPSFCQLHQLFHPTSRPDLTLRGCSPALPAAQHPGDPLWLVVLQVSRSSPSHCHPLSVQSRLAQTVLKAMLCTCKNMQHQIYCLRISYYLILDPFEERLSYICTCTGKNRNATTGMCTHAILMRMHWWIAACVWTGTPPV